MARTIETLLRENLHGVFGEDDIQKRQSNIARLWAEDGVFVDHNARYEGHSSIDHAASKLVEKFPTLSLRRAASLKHLTASEGSIGDSAPLERKPSSPASTCWC
jgi:hypothetical protein